MRKAGTQTGRNKRGGSLERGFTLIELLLVLVILATLAAVVVPKFTRRSQQARVTASRYLGTEGKYWIRVFPHKPVTSTPAETRMGKGKGEVEYWAAVVKPGTVLFEVGGVTEPVAREVFRRQAG